MALLAGAGPQLRVEPGGGGGQRDERVQAVPRALQGAHGGTQGHTVPGLIFRYKTFYILGILKILFLKIQQIQQK